MTVMSNHVQQPAGYASKTDTFRPLWKQPAFWATVVTLMAFATIIALLAVLR